MPSLKKLEFFKNLKQIRADQVVNFERGYYINQTQVANLLDVSIFWVYSKRLEPDFPKAVLVGKVAYWFKPNIEKYKKKNKYNLPRKRKVEKILTKEKPITEETIKVSKVDSIIEENDYLITSADIARILGVGLTLIEQMHTPGSVHYDPDFPSVILVGSKFKKFSKVKFDQWFNKIKSNGKTIVKEVEKL